MESKMLTEHAQGHAGSVKSENHKRKGEIGKWKGREIKRINN